MKKISILLLISLFFSVSEPLVSSVHFEKKYSYSHESIEQPLHFEDIFARESSLLPLAMKKIGKKATGDIVFGQPKNMFTLRIEKPDNLDVNENPNIILTINGQQMTAEIDDDGDERILSDKYLYTKPIFTNNAANVSYSVTLANTKKLPKNIELIGLNTSDYTETLAIGSDSQEAGATDSPAIISRKDWGADESFRYMDNPTWQKYYAKQAANTTPDSAATIAYNKKIADIRNYLATNFPEKEVPIETISEENGHKLVWPIEKTREVDKIVIHHSAEDNKSDKDDLTLLRGIYYYHAMVRGWGDIGYNYIVGQRGQIYEGRAGGDYTAGAHALWNNKSSVGICVLGNFETYNINRDQENGLKAAIKYVSQKYGIDLNKTTIGHRECQTNANQPCFLLNDFQTYNLIGHREIGYTSCPGTNLFVLLAGMREVATYSTGLTPVINPDTTLIDTNSNLNKGPTIKIRLSYTGNDIQIRSLNPTEPMILSLNNVSRPLKSGGISLRFTPYDGNKIRLWIGNKHATLPEIRLTASVLEVPNWNRTPAWDKNNTYNDNKFRGTLWLYNEGGSLVVVNELPLEDYLKGLAEISNTDNAEKIKTILVAARSYANWYIDPNNRKFPGKAYDGSDDPDVFQKYLGYGYELRSRNISKLVDETNGVIIQYQGANIKPWYFNQSAGKTLSAKEYCEKNKPRHAELVSASTQGDPETSSGGREGSAGGRTTTCPDIPYLQSVLDPAGNLGLKGHGVGISGAGATFLATQMEFTYDRIIKYFLDGVELKKIY